MEELFTAKQLADYLGWKLITVYRLTRKHEFDVVVIGKEYRYTKSAIDKFIKNHTFTAEDAEKLKADTLPAKEENYG